MTVRVQDLLHLSTLSKAHVMAGANALNKVVSSVSVIDFTATSVAQRELFRPDNSASEQLLLSSIVQMNNNVSESCQRVKQLARTGCVGIVIYYEGPKLPKLAQPVKAAADQLNFLIIFAQETQKIMTYSSVISEIMFAIFQDKTRHPDFSPTIISRVSSMPATQRSVDEVLKLLTEQLQASIAIVNDYHEVLYQQSWPRNNHIDWSQIINLADSLNVDGQLPLTTSDGFKINYRRILSNHVTILFSSKRTISQTACARTIETIQTALNLWDQQKHNVPNLVHAILQGQTERINQLSRQYQFDPQATRAVILINCSSETDKSTLKKFVEQITLPYTKNFFADWYNNKLVVLLSSEITYQDWQNWQHEFANSDLMVVQECTVVLSTMADGIGGIQRLYQLASQYWSVMRTILPHRSFYSQADLEFARSCQRELQNEGTTVIRWQKRLDVLTHNLVETLLTYLLDTPQSIEQSARILYVHRNTIKYRLNKISSHLGFMPGVMPASLELYLALGVHRLLRSNDAIRLMHE